MKFTSSLITSRLDLGYLCPSQNSKAKSKLLSSPGQAFFLQKPNSLPCVRLQQVLHRKDLNHHIANFFLILTVLCPVHPHLWETIARMADGQGNRRNRDHDSVQDNESILILHDRIAPSICHFRDTEDASCENGDVGEGDGASKQFEPQGGEELVGRLWETGAMLVHAGDIQPDEQAEDHERHDLPDDTRQHHGVARVGQR